LSTIRSSETSATLPSSVVVSSARTSIVSFHTSLVVVQAFRPAASGRTCRLRALRYGAPCRPDSALRASSRSRRRASREGGSEAKAGSRGPKPDVASNSVDRAGTRPARVATGATWTDGSVGRRVRERLRRRARLRGEHRQQLLQIDAGAGRAAGRLPLAGQVLEVMAATAAFVFKKRHGLF